MQQPPADALSKALAFAGGLRRNVTGAGARWLQWPRGERDLAAVVAAIDATAERLRALSPDAGAEALAPHLSDLRAILEWTTYQATALTTARALAAARRTRTLGRRFGILTPAAQTYLEDSDESLLAAIRAQNAYMTTLQERNPHLSLPRPLVAPEALAQRPAQPPSRLELIRALTKGRRR